VHQVMKPMRLTEVTYIFTYRSSGAVPSHDCFQRWLATFSTYRYFVAASTSGGGVGSGTGGGRMLPTLNPRGTGVAGLKDGAAVGMMLRRRSFSEERRLDAPPGARFGRGVAGT